jgi:hypothetical protein
VSINIHNMLYCWDSVKETHMTERGWTGTRYTIVLYNTGGRQAVADLGKGFLSVAQTPEVATARTIALAVLDTTPFSKDRSDSSKGQPRKAYLKEALATNPPYVITFGASTKGKGKGSASGVYQQNANNTNRELKQAYTHVSNYLNLLHPNLFNGTDDSTFFNAMAINKNAVFGPHKDNKTNVGYSAITALGDFSGGGGLLIQTDPATATAVPLPASAGEQYLCMRYRLSLVCAVRMQVRKWHSW